MTWFLCWHHTFSVMNGFGLWCFDESFQKEAQIRVPAEPVVPWLLVSNSVYPCVLVRAMSNSLPLCWWASAVESIWRNPSPAPQLQCDVTKAKTKTQYFFLTSLNWTVSAELQWSCLKIPQFFHWGLICSTFLSQKVPWCQVIGVYRQGAKL